MPMALYIDLCFNVFILLGFCVFSVNHCFRFVASFLEKCFSIYV